MLLLPKGHNDGEKPAVALGSIDSKSVLDCILPAVPCAPTVSIGIRKVLGKKLAFPVHRSALPKRGGRLPDWRRPTATGIGDHPRGAAGLDEWGQSWTNCPNRRMSYPFRQRSGGADRRANRGVLQGPAGTNSPTGNWPRCAGGSR